MDGFDIYKDIAERTNGDIYIGVVGPVRTGKSTFIKRFMDLLVIPNIENTYSKERAKDELPQSSAGKTIMTTEPKFVPNEAVDITLNENVAFKVRMIDCVGYLVEGAMGHMDEEGPRMVNTPWSDKQMPFAEAAEIGTKKVISEHSTIGVVITTDGTVTDISRDGYIQAEERVISELREMGKPFVIILNTSRPFEPETEALRLDLSEKYKAPVVALNCAQLKEDDINIVMEKALYEFPLKEIKINFPKWIEPLDISHWMKQNILASVKNMILDVSKLREVRESVRKLEESEYIKKAFIEKIELGQGSVGIEIAVDEALFYRVLSETCGLEIHNDYELISTIKKLADIKKSYDKISYALEEVGRKGYGVVTPILEEIKLEEPEIVKHGSRYGIRLRACAPSIHMIKADIETEIAPIVGTEKQSSELIENMMKEFSTEPEKIWESNIFGKSLYDLVTEGLQNKLYKMPEDAQVKLQETLQKIINEGSGGLICIIL